MSENIGNDAGLAKDAPSSNNTSHIVEPDVGSTANQNTNHNDEPNTRESITAAMASQGPPPLEVLASQSTRTHRHWTPKYGRVQKCDWCNGRSAGTLQVCSSCSLRMCEDCARNLKWHTNRSHFVDADACDWSLKKPSSKRGSKRPAPPSSVDEPRRKVSKTVKSRHDEDDDYDSADDDDSFRNPGTGRRQFPAPISARDDAGRLIGRPSTTPDGHWQDTLPHRQATAPRGSAQPAAAEPEITVASTRPYFRQAAAKALQGMTELARRSSCGTPEEDGGEEDDNDYEDEEEDGAGDVYKEKGVVKKVNDPHRRRGNNSAQIPGGRPLSRAGTEREHTSSPLVGASGRHPLPHQPAPTAEDIEHDRIILDLYDWIYGNRPNIDPRRARTQIPDHWAGDWQTSAYQYGRESSPYGYNPYPSPHYPPPGYGQFPAHMPPPPPPGYPSYPVHHYPEYAHHNNPGYNQGYGPGPGPASGPPYIPTARHNPAYHPYNEHTPTEAEHARQDRQTHDEMINAWMHHPLLLRLVSENRRVYAIGLLWDVLEVRRARVYIRDDSQTVRWFVTERDRQFRMQHEAYAYAQGPVRGVTPGLVRGQSPAMVQARGQTPARFPTPVGGQAQWAGMGGHGGRAEGAAHRRGESVGVDYRSKNSTVMLVDNGDEVDEE